MDITNDLRIRGRAHGALISRAVGELRASPPPEHCELCEQRPGSRMDGCFWVCDSCVDGGRS